MHGIRRLTLAGMLLVAVAQAAMAAESAEKSFSLDVNGGKVPATQRVIRVTKGDSVRIRVSSNAPGELHLHGYRLEAKVAPGTPTDLAFVAHATGRFPLEWHGSGPAPKAGGHHGPSMAALEVHPR